MRSNWITQLRQDLEKTKEHNRRLVNANNDLVKALSKLAQGFGIKDPSYPDWSDNMKALAALELEKLAKKGAAL